MCFGFNDIYRKRECKEKLKQIAAEIFNFPGSLIQDNRLYMGLDCILSIF